MKSPFKFLDAYDQQDREVFFGRDEEIEALYNMVFKTQLMMVFGLSGTGKTSLVRCGLASKFNGPNWYPFYIRRDNDINSAIQKALGSAMPEGQLPFPSLTENVAFLFNHFLRPVYLIFDQFEELFIQEDNTQEQQQFALAIKTLLAAKIHCKVILVIREEFIGRMYLLEQEIPTLFDFRLRVEPMSGNKIQEVVAGSLQQFNIELEEPEINLPKFYERIHDKKSNLQFQLPYLQVFLDMLWREDFARTYSREEQKNWEPRLLSKPIQYPPLIFKTKELDQFGSIENVLSRFLYQQEKGLTEELLQKSPKLARNTVRSIIDSFVTEYGTKLPLAVQVKENEVIALPETLQKFPSLPEGILSYVLNRLVASRLLRQRDDTLELAHDSLAELINKERSEDDRRINGIKVRLSNALYEFQQSKRKTWPSQKLILDVNETFNRLNLSPELVKFYQQSKRELERRVNRKWQIGVLIGVVVGIVAFFFIQYIQKDASNKKLNTYLFIKLTEVTPDATASFKEIIKTSRQVINNASAMAVSHQIYSENEFYLQTLQHPSQVLGVALSLTNAGKFIYSWTNEKIYRSDWHGKFLDSIAVVNTISDCQLSPDGRWLAYGDSEGNLVLVNAITMNDTQQYKVTERKIDKLAFDVTNTYLYYAEAANNGNPNDKSYYKNFADHFSYKVCKVTFNALDKPIQQIQFVSSRITSIAQNPKDQTVWLGFADGFTEERDANLHLQKRTQNHHDQVLSFAFSPNGGSMVSADRNGLLYFWNSKVSLQAHDQRINQVIWSPDGSRIFTASKDNTIKTWSPKGEGYATYRGHTNIVTAISVSTNGGYFASASEDGLVHLWKTESKILKKFGPHQNGAAAILLAPKTQILITASDQGENDIGDALNDPGVDVDKMLANLFQINPREVSVWNRINSNKIMGLKKHQGGVTVLCKNNTDSTWASADQQGQIWLWTGFKSPRPLKSLVGHQGAITQAVFSADGLQLMSGGEDSLCILWQVHSKSKKIIRQTAPVSGIVSTPDGSWIVALDAELRVYDQEGAYQRSLPIKGIESIKSLAVSPNGQYLLVGEWGYYAHLLSIKGDSLARVELLGQNKTGAQAINVGTFSPDNITFCIGGEGGLATVYRIYNGVPLPIRTLQHYPKKSILALQFSADGQQVYTGCADGWVRLWDLKF